MKRIFIMLLAVLTSCVEGQRVVILAAPNKCRQKDAVCFCKKKGILGEYADFTSKCRSWYVCVSSTQAYYKTCPSGLRFNEATGNCDWKNAVQCVATNDRPVKPKPKPKPSPVKPKPQARPPPVKAKKRPPPPRRRPPPPEKSSLLPIPSPFPSPSPRPSPSISPIPVSPSPSPPPTPTPTPSPTPVPPTTSDYLYVGYYQSWSDPWSPTAAISNLSKLPPYVNVINLSFMRPDNSYSGGTTLAGTGLDFSSDASVVKEAIALLKQRNPGTKVLIAVGGATYTNWAAFNPAGVAAFVQEFGLDGVDLDYEPPSADCRIGTDGLVSCSSDAEYLSVTRALRDALPRPAMLSAAMWSIGAYGEGIYASASPQGQYTGVSINVLRNAGDAFDMINIMSYDAGPTYNPKQALDAYSALYSGKITLGVEVANEAWGGHVITLDEVNSLADYVKAKGAAGMMLWSLQKLADQGPTAVQISQTVCVDLGLPDCTCGLVCET